MTGCCFARRDGAEHFPQEADVQMMHRPAHGAIVQFMGRECFERGPVRHGMTLPAGGQGRRAPGPCYPSPQARPLIVQLTGLVLFPWAVDRKSTRLNSSHL